MLVSRVSLGAVDVSSKFLHLGSRLDGKHEGFESLWGFFVLIFLLIVFFYCCGVGFDNALNWILLKFEFRAPGIFLTVILITIRRPLKEVC